ncbi:hypothetical protein FRC14_002665 [Serendipita sp. 396]|nr:hypothetical protein FRC14_002665 [Serendipita sp. 396]KAG8772751.1 hypothetical protein FRC15_002535 [Serendipita sp. 397]KAG8815568.1 hypothetical protein FRC19_000946 [Serendipita sp. 401]KAG8855062.1 hypothetical protein FRC20_000846 [Serendipita sp. 405]
MLIIVAWVLCLAVNSALSGITPSTTEDATALTVKTPASGVTVGANNVGRSTPSESTPSPAPGRTLFRRVTAPPASQKQITNNSAPNETARPFTGTLIASNEGGSRAPSPTAGTTPSCAIIAKTNIPHRICLRIIRPLAMKDELGITVSCM